ncbi:MAG TPA: diaminopropionate ammonia-lyase [Ktedonobacteraceae bacterium]
MAIQIFENTQVLTDNNIHNKEKQTWNFHKRLPGYTPTPLLEAPQLARQLGVGNIWIKDETRRFDMPSFKILGTSWAVYRALMSRMGKEIVSWETFDDLARIFSPLCPLTLVAATDGNHGRAVAHMAALLGFDSHIFVPRGMAQSRINAIKNEGAKVTIVNGTYDEAVRQSAIEQDDMHVVISDTSWLGYEEIPTWVIEGYATIFQEVDAQLARQYPSSPDLILVQIGVGALAAAVVQHYHAADDVSSPKIVGVEPTTAACMLASMKANRIVSLTTPPRTIMAGLNCDTPSLIAWPIVSKGVDLFISIEDEWARQGMRKFATLGLVSGETGAAGIGGVLALLNDPSLSAARASLGIDNSTRILVICTEGATAPIAYEQIVGTSPYAISK